MLQITWTTISEPLTGKHTFHGMGIIAAVTPYTKQTRCVPRRKVTARELSEAGKIEIHHYDERRLQEVEIKYNDVAIARLWIPWKI